MHRRLSTNGYLYAIRRLAEHWQEKGIKGLDADDDARMTALLDAAEPGTWRDDSTTLLVAAEVLVDAADARSATARHSDGGLACLLDFSDAYEALDDAPNDDERDDFEPDDEDDADSDDSDDE